MHSMDDPSSLVLDECPQELSGKSTSFEAVTEWSQPEWLQLLWEIRTQLLALSKQPGIMFPKHFGSKSTSFEVVTK